MEKKITLPEAFERCDYYGDIKDAIFNLVSDNFGGCRLYLYSKKVLSSTSNFILIRYKIPVKLKGNQYYVPLLIYLIDSFPLGAPEIYLEKRSSKIEINHNLPKDLISLTDLRINYELYIKWTKEASCLPKVIDYLEGVFTANFPFYSGKTEKKFSGLCTITNAIEILSDFPENSINKSKTFYKDPDEYQMNEILKLVTTPTPKGPEDTFIGNKILESKTFENKTQETQVFKSKTSESKSNGNKEFDDRSFTSFFSINKVPSKNKLEDSAIKDQLIKSLLQKVKNQVIKRKEAQTATSIKLTNLLSDLKAKNEKIDKLLQKKSDIYACLNESMRFLFSREDFLQYYRQTIMALENSSNLPIPEKAISLIEIKNPSYLRKTTKEETLSELAQYIKKAYEHKVIGFQECININRKLFRTIFFLKESKFQHPSE